MLKGSVFNAPKTRYTLLILFSQSLLRFTLKITYFLYYRYIVCYVKLKREKQRNFTL